MTSRFYRLVRLVLAVAILILVAASGYLAWTLVEEGSLIGRTYHQGTWGAVQNDAEALKLLLAIERYRRTGAAADLQALATQRELYLSRIYFLRDSQETDQHGGGVGVKEVVHPSPDGGPGEVGYEGKVRGKEQNGEPRPAGIEPGIEHETRGKNGCSFEP